MLSHRLLPPIVPFLLLLVPASVLAQEQPRADGMLDLQPLRYHHPGLVVDLGVGLWAWPLPMDFDGDGDLDLVVNCPDKPFNGVYWFENPDGSTTPVFKPPRRISDGKQNVQVSYVAGRPWVLTPGQRYPDFLQSGLGRPESLGVPANFHQPLGSHSQKVRANQWKYCDFDGDGDQDLVVGIGDWSDYGWDDAYDTEGRWTRGPLHGLVYILLNTGTDELPGYAAPTLLHAGGKPVDVFGWPSPNFADFDGDGDLDLLCGEFLDGFTYFANHGSRTSPEYAAGIRLTSNGQPLRMDLQMIVPVAIDWDHDGDQDLIVGDEDGRVAWIEHGGVGADGIPQFRPPVYFQQEADWVKCGALATPAAVDWDGDGDEDVISGNTAGYLVFYENLGQDADAKQPRWAAPERLEAAGQTIRIQAGASGSIQGPCEAKWGYTTLSAADWDLDGLPDLVINSIWGKIQWYRNVGSRTQPKLAAAQDVRVAWPEGTEPPKPAWTWWKPQLGQLATQWRTTPVVIDWQGDKLPDLVMLDHEGYLALYARTRVEGELWLLPPARIFFDQTGAPLRLNDRTAGGSGRRKLTFVDWNQDGRLDLLVNGRNADWYEQLATSRPDHVVFAARGPVAERFLSSHTTSPTTVDWNQNDLPDLLIGAEDGHLYYLPR